jgi:hypothetical protein
MHEGLHHLADIRRTSDLFGRGDLRLVVWGQLAVRVIVASVCAAIVAAVRVSRPHAPAG